MQNVAFVVNQHKPGANELAAELATIARSHSATPAIYHHFPLQSDALQQVDLCVVVGGDGTLLGIVEAASRHTTPVLGVNLGRLGFMASFSPERVRATFSQFLLGDFASRQLAVLTCSDAKGQTVYALNDIVIKASSSRLIRLKVDCEEEHMNTYHADGVIFATPTGSTAYNLSAGGPIIHPAARVLAVTPINPHTLSNRSIVLDDSHQLRVQPLQPADPIQIAVDGRSAFRDPPAFPIKLRVHPSRRFPLIQPADYSHYAVLRSKLRWTGDAVFSGGNPNADPIL